MNRTRYDTTMHAVQMVVHDFLVALESVQQSILFHQVDAAQDELARATGTSLAKALTDLKAISPPAAQETAHHVLERAVELLLKAQQLFAERKNWPEFATHYLASRGYQSRALAALYHERHSLDVIEPFFCLQDRPLPPADIFDGVISRGLQNIDRTSTHHDYALYVPEYAEPDTPLPMIVCLHGSHGRGDEYLWTWLRVARSCGYVVLSPKSIAPTWSFMQPALDADSILSMMDEVVAQYPIDRSRVVLTGLSDGATFAFNLGLEHAQRFAALAPVAGVLSPMTDPLLRAGRGKDLPIHVVHGAYDPIFAVQAVRSTTALLEKLGYAVTYTELPEWGHALTYRINEEILLPWIEERV